MKYKDFFVFEQKEGKKTSEKVTKDVAQRIYNSMHYPFDFDEFHMGMNVEMEHKNVTKGDLKLTAKIAAAHLKENPKYYTLLKQHVEKQK